MRLTAGLSATKTKTKTKTKGSVLGPAGGKKRCMLLSKIPPARPTRLGTGPLVGPEAARRWHIKCA
ncbi:hypothetical protein predicted by Glimmer/Critica [Acetobacter senegalensis]|uniref:Uncharacterized protein n=1 Tax=Acetobacter senegalensis TaxID=446692 RepID=A0A0U5EWX7_9PROT|nr:hypothetical protein [Acetobacter senegalensis]CEF40593.1 hypothetical protein predicted by Glimmer/Critica [Acetobacter senegalensis]